MFTKPQQNPTRLNMWKKAKSKKKKNQTKTTTYNERETTEGKKSALNIIKWDARLNE